MTNETDKNAVAIPMTSATQTVLAAWQSASLSVSPERTEDSVLIPFCTRRPQNEFRKELENLLNRHSKENGSDTPDFLLANFLIGIMDVYDLTVRKRDAHRKG